MVIKAAVPSMADEVDDVVLSVMNAGGGASEDVTGARLIAALFFGYSSAVLYIGSRIPQIVQNVRQLSVYVLFHSTDYLFSSKLNHAKACHRSCLYSQSSAT